MNRVRGRCGRCDTALDLGRLRPYRIVPAVAPTAEQADRAARHLAVGLDHPALATEIAQNVARSAAQDVTRLEPVFPKAQISEVSEPGSQEPASLHEVAPEAAAPALPAEAASAAASTNLRWPVTLALGSAAGVIAGLGVSWTLGRTATIGMIAGAVLGVVVGWAWLRWTSPK